MDGRASAIPRLSPHFSDFLCTYTRQFSCFPFFNQNETRCALFFSLLSRASKHAPPLSASRYTLRCTNYYTMSFVDQAVLYNLGGGASKTARSRSREPALASGSPPYKQGSQSRDRLPENTDKRTCVQNIQHYYCMVRKRELAR